MTLSRDELLDLVKYGPLVSIDLVVRNGFEQILLGLRNNEPAKNYWFVPRGHVQKNESIEDTFERICDKELGIKYEIGNAKFLGVFRHDYETNFAEEIGIGTDYVVLAYEITLTNRYDVLSFPVGDPPEFKHRKFKWFDDKSASDDDNVHRYTKDYFFISSSNETQYATISSRHDTANNLLWQTPVLSLTAQAFLFTIALNSNVEAVGRSIAAALALVTALASIQLMIKHRLYEEEYFKWLRDFELRNKWKGYALVSTKIIPRHGQWWIIRFLQKPSSYILWIIVLSLFAAAAGGVLYETGGTLYDLILGFLNQLFERSEIEGDSTSLFGGLGRPPAPN